MDSTDLRPINVTILHDAAWLSVSLSDSRSVARVGRVDSPALLDELKARAAPTGRRWGPYLRESSFAILWAFAFAGENCLAGKSRTFQQIACKGGGAPLPRARNLGHDEVLRLIGEGDAVHHVEPLRSNACIDDDAVWRIGSEPALLSEVASPLCPPRVLVRQAHRLPLRQFDGSRRISFARPRTVSIRTECPGSRRSPRRRQRPIRVRSGSGSVTLPRRRLAHVSASLQGYPTREFPNLSI